MAQAMTAPILLAAAVLCVAGVAKLRVAVAGSALVVAPVRYLGCFGSIRGLTRSRRRALGHPTS